MFFNVPVLTSGTKFEYVFRELIEYINPEWKLRKKDIKAKEYFKDIEKDNRNLFLEFNSYNPFWINKGYSENTPPVLITGKLLIEKRPTKASTL